MTLRREFLEISKSSSEDSMHARYHSPLYGRFLSVDPINSGRPGSPQSWNRYAYVRNNPLRYVDPDGRQEVPSVPRNPLSAIRRLIDAHQRQLFLSSDESSKGKRMLEAFTLGALGGAVVIGTFDDLFGQAELQDDSSSIGRVGGNEADAKNASDAIVGESDKADEGVFVGKDKETGRTIVLRQRSTDRGGAHSTIEEQRTTDQGRVRARKARYDRDEDEEDPP